MIISRNNKSRNNKSKKQIYKIKNKNKNYISKKCNSRYTNKKSLKKSCKRSRKYIKYQIGGTKERDELIEKLRQFMINKSKSNKSKNENNLIEISQNQLRAIILYLVINADIIGIENKPGSEIKSDLILAISFDNYNDDLYSIYLNSIITFIQDLINEGNIKSIVMLNDSSSVSLSDFKKYFDSPVVKSLFGSEQYVIIHGIINSPDIKDYSNISSFFEESVKKPLPISSQPKAAAAAVAVAIPGPISKSRPLAAAVPSVMKEPLPKISSIKTFNNLRKYTSAIQMECDKKISEIKARPLDLSRYVKLQSLYINANNVCFLHSVLQMLRNIPEIHAILEQFAARNKLANLLYLELARIGGVTDSTREIVISCTDFGSPLKYGQQQDASVMLSWIIEKILTNTLNPPDIFKIGLNVITFNPETDFVYTNIQDKTNYFELLLNFEIGKNNYKSLSDIINYRLSPQLAEGYKYYDKLVTAYTQNLTIIYPETKYIIIRLNIFNMDRTLKKIKIDLTISEIDNFICISGIVFELISIVTHIGSSIDGGHYINYSRQNTGDGKVQWIEYNDIDPNHKFKGDILTNDNMSGNPYIILCKKV